MPKCELIVIQLQDTPPDKNREKWKIQDTRGNTIHEKEPEEGETEVSARYVGIHLQKEGFRIHVQKTTKKMTAANGALENLVLDNWPTPLTAHRQLYIAKVRSIALYGAEVFGTDNCQTLNKAEPRLLRQLCKSFRRPKNDMIL